MVFVADSDALFLALQGGNIDAATVTGGIVEQLDPARFDIIHEYSNSVQVLALNNAVKPLDDIRVRQAINYGVDVSEIIETAFYGRGEPWPSPVIPGLTQYRDADLKPYPTDPEKARQLLAEAGYPQGFPLEITVPSNYTMHIDTAQVIVNQLATIGISAAIKRVDWPAWVSGVYRNRKYQATVISVDGAVVSPQSYLFRYVSDSEVNFVNFNSPAFDQIYRAALKERTMDRRTALYREAQRIISAEAASVYIQDIYDFKAFTKGRYDGIIHYPLYVIDFSTIYSRK
jgi:peptide/nickel transport system substrate-binding protein